MSPPGSWIWLAAVALQLAGGAAYAAARAFEGGPQRLTRAVWRTQIVALALGGPLFAWAGSGAILRLLAVTSWFALALPFVAGLYLFELFDRRWWERARLE